MKVAAVVFSLALGAVFAGLAPGGQRAGTAVPSWCTLPGTTVGQAVRVSPVAKVNGNTIGTGTVTLFANDVLTTNGNGALRLCLRKKATVCSTFPGSNLKTVNGNTLVNPVVRFNAGVSTCVTSLTGTNTYGTGTSPSRVTLTVNDPLWAVDVDAKGTTVGVELGFIEVSGQKSGRKRAVIVGPGQQVFVPRGGDPEPVTAFVPSPQITEGFDFLRPFLPAISFDRPPAGDSPTLRRIYERGVIAVGYDAKNVGATPGAAQFVKSFFGFLARSWKVKLRLVAVSQVQAEQLLASGDLDLFASPQPPAPNPSFPFFTSPKGLTWRLVDGSDSAFDDAVNSFLRNDLNSGQYATAYRKAFRAQPTYAVFRSLLFTP